MDTVTDQLRKDILSGHLGPGERLLEVHLADQYECGRAAIRSAFVALGAEGLVEREANRGATVRKITIGEAIQITEARAALESLIAAQAARNATAEDREELKSIIDRMRTAVANEKSVDYSKLNGQLHRRLREVSSHAVAAQLVANLRDRAAHQQYRLAGMPGRPEQSLEQHAAIVEAVVAGDPDAAAKAMGAHLQSVIDVLNNWNDAT